MITLDALEKGRAKFGSTNRAMRDRNAPSIDPHITGWQAKTMRSSSLHERMSKFANVLFAGAFVVNSSQWL